MARTVKTGHKRRTKSRHPGAKQRPIEPHSSRPANRKSHKGDTINKWNEESMMQAIKEFHLQTSSASEQKLTLRAIARAYDVPFETLRRRIKGKLSTDRPSTELHEHQLGKKTILSPVAEKELAQHIKDLASVGFPCTRDDIRTLAYEYAASNSIVGFSEKKRKAGYYWFEGFMRRFPQLSVKSAENLSVPRAMSMNPTQVLQWFSAYNDILHRLDIEDCPNHIWNRRNRLPEYSLCKRNSWAGWHTYIQFNSP